MTNEVVTELEARAKLMMACGELIGTLRRSEKRISIRYLREAVEPIRDLAMLRFLFQSSLLMRDEPRMVPLRIAVAKRLFFDFPYNIDDVYLIMAGEKRLAHAMAREMLRHNPDEDDLVMAYSFAEGLRRRVIRILRQRPTPHHIWSKLLHIDPSYNISIANQLLADKPTMDDLKMILEVSPSRARKAAVRLLRYELDPQTLMTIISQVPSLSDRAAIKLQRLIEIKPEDHVDALALLLSVPRASDWALEKLSNIEGVSIVLTGEPGPVMLAK
jgi:hypothetical protein